MEQAKFDPVAHHSNIAQKFDERYLTCIGFRDRLEKWTDLINKWITPGARVLDAGCGSGVLSACLLHLADKITALDGSAEMLEIAKTKFSEEERQKITFIHSQLPLTQDLPAYDAILCSSVIEYLDDMDATLRSFSEHLTPGGILILSYPNLYSPKRWLDPVAYKLIKKPRFYPYMKNKPRTPGWFSKHMDKLGFETIDVEYSGRITSIRIRAMEFTLPLFIIVARKKT